MPNLNVNLSDPAAIRAALPEVRSRITEARARMEAAKADVDSWQSLLFALEGLAAPGSEETQATAGDARDQREVDSDDEPENDADADHDAGPRSNAVDTVVTIVERIGGPANIGVVHEQMPALKHKTVGWALWKATQTGRIQRLRQGVYAPLSFPAEQFTLAASKGEDA